MLLRGSFLAWFSERVYRDHYNADYGKEYPPTPHIFQNRSGTGTGRGYPRGILRDNKKAP